MNYYGGPKSKASPEDNRKACKWCGSTRAKKFYTRDAREVECQNGDGCWRRMYPDGTLVELSDSVVYSYDYPLGR